MVAFFLISSAHWVFMGRGVSRRCVCVSVCLSVIFPHANVLSLEMRAQPHPHTMDRTVQGCPLVNETASPGLYAALQLIKH